MTKAFHLAQSSSHDVEVLLHTHTPVTAVRPVSDSKSNTTRRYRLETPRGTIECDIVVHATNAYANALISPEASGVRVVPTRGQVVAVRPNPVERATAIKGGWGANEGFEYWFPRPANSGDAGQLVVLGGGREVALPRYEFYEADDSKINEDVGAALRKFLPGVYPKLYSGVEAEWEWSGIMGFTPTGDPFVRTSSLYAVLYYFDLCAIVGGTPEGRGREAVHLGWIQWAWDASCLGMVSLNFPCRWP
jgi:glycine/D-amino acid oxidase-like deaminating enzyme